MALLKRRTRPKKEPPIAERELLPEGPRPSPEELKAYNEKFAAAKSDGRKRLVDGRPVIWPHTGHPEQEEREDARREVNRGERRIDEILSTGRNSPHGRKADPVYDKAAYQVRVARSHGKKISVKDLTRQFLVSDKSGGEDKFGSGEEAKIDKLKKALKRRRRNSRM
jgi:hypothetical protein